MGRIRSVVLGVIMVSGPLLVSACDDPVGPSQTLLTEAPWEWASACCGIAGNTRTPSTEGFTYHLRFGDDGIVRAERDGTVLLETTFTVQTTTPVDFQDQFTVVTYGAPLPLGPAIESVSRQMVIFLEDDRLLLRNLDGCADCFGDWEFDSAQ